MSTDFRIVALERARFEPLFALDDAAPGESVLLLHHEHHAVHTPYRASGPIFVRERAETARPNVSEVPAMLTNRLLSVRACDEAGMLQDSEVLQGDQLAAAIRRFFADRGVAYLHVHNARPGCFNCRVERA
jgi:hypothetical protein